ncbi:hypothetical protein SAY86_009648 [Trapa natans]|uniref:Uncharacterized protein n=1 Tax=Trapa natans TaxID=22666 RepID=A0AAN7L227_TRANT|nr:hypothetical protein SAY86_009648 [Trapa natans]
MGYSKPPPMAPSLPSSSPSAKTHLGPQSQSRNPPPPLPPPDHPGHIHTHPTEWKYDVFVSYRGEDIKKGFRSHLFQALQERAIDYFWDDDPEGRGNEVRSEIFTAIHRSRVALVVLSPRYADSKWCLDELVEILTVKRKTDELHNKQQVQVHDQEGGGTCSIILPIFFGVSVGDVRKQEGEFGKAFERVKKGKTKDEVMAWKDALVETCGLGGLHLENDCNWDESLLIGNILEWLFARNIPYRYCTMGRDVVGRDQEAEEVISLYSNLSQQQHKDAAAVAARSVIIGIHGIPEIGKTTLAKLVFGRIYREFKCVGFLENVRNETPESLSEKLLRTVAPYHRSMQYEHQAGRLLSISRKLCQTKALLVFDDVDHPDKVRAFLEDRERFSPGSLTLVTSRDERVLRELEVDGSYMVPALSSEGSMQLFGRRLFGTDETPEGFRELSESLCHYAGGLPKKLEKLISHVNAGGTRDEWERTLEKLVRNPSIDCLVSPTKVGPFPQSRIRSFDDKEFTGIRQMKIVTVGPMIESITVDYDQSGCLVRPGQYGGTRHGKTQTIKLDYPREYLTSISGHLTSHDPEIIQSLKIQSNVKEYGAYGSEEGRKFEFPKTYNTKIIGFHGHFGDSLHSIGAYSRSVSDNFPFNSVGPFGGQDGEEWDDGRYTGIRQINVVSDKVIESISVWYDDHGRPTGESKRGESAGGKLHSVKLDYPDEYLTSISGYVYAKQDSKEDGISSITLQSNLKSYKFGTETGQQFSFPAKCGKIVGFYGRSLEKRLVSIGAHFELVSHIYPFKKMGPFGRGGRGDAWDDGKHSNIKQITVKYGSAINAIICEYESPDSVTRHGGNGDEYHVIVLDYPDEYITAMCGYIADETQSVVNSLTFQSNRRVWGPFGTEEGTYFSLPLNSGKIVGFYGRTDGEYLNSIGAHVEIYSSKLYPFKSVGLFDVGEEERWDDGAFAVLKKIEIIMKDSVVKTMKFDYETPEGVIQKRSHGADAKGKTHTIALDRDEYLTAFSGYYNDYDGCIGSLTFQSNKRTRGPYGITTGKYFSSPMTGGKMVGFYGRSSGVGLISIGAHFEPISNLYPAKRIGPFGREVGNFWSDKNSNAVMQVRVLSDKAGIVRIYALYKRNEGLFWSSERALEESPQWKVDTVTLDYPNEHLTSISGYIRDYSEPVIVQSLTFHSNKRSYGPFGKDGEKKQKGSYFWYPSTGSKIVSFYGHCIPSYLSSIGVYAEPIFHLYPCVSVGPFGGQQGKPWDDGTFTDVREIYISYGSVITAFGVEYDNNGSPVRCPDHGNDWLYVASNSSAEAKEAAGAWPAKRADSAAADAKLKSVTITLDFPRERLVSISGYVGIKYGEEVVRSLTVKTNLQTHPAYGSEKGERFQLPKEENCGRMIGFHGTSGRFLNSLGARLEPC